MTRDVAPGGVMLSASTARRCSSKRPTKSSRRVTVSGMAGMDVYVSEDDVRRYVAETLRRDKRSDWDIDAITRDVIAEWPDLVGAHPDLVDMPGPDYVAGWLERAIQPESRYRDIFARHRVRRLAE
jgi:hypothetical protein